MRRWIRYGGRRLWFWLAALAVIFVLSLQHSVALILRSRVPETALAIAPGDARILAAAAAMPSLSLTATPLERALARERARAALLREPGNVSAAGTLGLLAAIEGREAQARRFFNYSVVRSRRDIRAQLWLIEDAVAQGSISRALEHYDIALRTSRTAPDLLFPVLLSAIDDPQVRKGLVGILRDKPLWREEFEGYLARHTQNFSAAAALFTMLARSDTPPSSANENILLSNMVTADDVDLAWRYYRLRHPRYDAIQPRNASFSPQGGDGSPFDWGLINDNGISTTLGNDAEDGALSFAVSPSMAGTVAQQLQRLRPGTYRLSGRSRAIGAPAKDHVRWEVACSDGRLLGKAIAAPSESTPSRFMTDFTVPANCASQLLRLTVLPGDDVEGISGEMLDIRFDRRRSS